MTTRYVVIGNSAAGAAAAKEIRTRDSAGEIVMISRDRAFYSRVQLPALLTGRKTLAEISFVPPDWAAQFRVAVRLGTTVTGLDPVRQTILVAPGDEIRYDRLLIASGADTVFPPIPGLRGTGTFGFRNLDDAEAVHARAGTTQRIAIIGAGLVGCELALVLAGLGKEVTLFEVAPFPLPAQLEEETGRLCAELLTGHGIRLVCGDPATMIERESDGRLRALRLRSGATIAAEAIVCAAGVRPHAEFAGGEALGRRRGILIDNGCQTSLANIFAAGDVAEIADAKPGEAQPAGLWSMAMKQGRTAGANLAGGRETLSGSAPLRVTINLAGTSMVAVGPAVRDRSWRKQVVRSTDAKGRMSIKVFFLAGTALKAAVLWGDTASASACAEAIADGRSFIYDSH